MRFRNLKKPNYYNFYKNIYKNFNFINIYEFLKPIYSYQLHRIFIIYQKPDHYNSHEIIQNNNFELKLISSTTIYGLIGTIELKLAIQDSLEN